MYELKSFVFFDIETTGLPWQEKNKTKITELSFVAALREDILRITNGDSLPVSKLTLLFNPCKPIHPEAVKITGLSNELLKNAPIFQRKLQTILSFLQELPKPVCMVAHNGNIFDYKILLAEFNDANASLPNDILCVDSLIGFKSVLKDFNAIVLQQKPIISQKVKPPPALMTDDEDEWPDLNASKEDWEDIDNICNSLSDISCEDISEEPIKVTSPKKTEISQVIQNEINKEKSNKRSEVIRKVFKKGKKSEPSPNGYSLGALYKRLMNKEAVNSHRAEDDCLMLLQCVVAIKDTFIPWADSACKRVVEIQPLNRF